MQMACSKSGHLMELRIRKNFETNNERKIRKVSPSHTLALSLTHILSLSS